MTPQPRIALVVAVADNGVIGAAGTLPWHLPADLRRFRRLTLGKPVLMGRRTFDALPGPLRGRTNFVLTHRPQTLPSGVAGVADLADALARSASLGPWLYVIGGVGLIVAALPRAQRFYLTRVHGCPPGDAYFPAWDTGAWQVLARERHGTDGRHAYAMTFETLLRVRTDGC
jgi:dihydrofolate reductase